LATPNTSSGFIALRAATLGVHDLVRRDLRAWLNTAVDFRGDIIEPAPPEDETLRVFAGAIAALSRDDRRDYRLWVMNWTDYTGRVITPTEKSARIERLRADATARGIV